MFLLLGWSLACNGGSIAGDYQDVYIICIWKDHPQEPQLQPRINYEYGQSKWCYLVVPAILVLLTTIISRVKHEGSLVMKF